MSNDLDRKLAALKGWTDDVNKTSRKDPKAPFVPDESVLTVVPSLSSGSPSFDGLIGGGWPRGRMSEVYGLESSGKSTLAYQTIAELHRRDPNSFAILLDAETSFDPARARRMGIDMGDPKTKRASRLLRIIPRGPAEPALEQIRQLAGMVDPETRKPIVDLIVVDSIAALVPEAEESGEVGDQTMAALARMMSKFLRMFNLAIANSGTTILFINQTRTKVGVTYGDPTVVPGGKGIDYWMSLMVSVSAPVSERIKDKDGEVLAITPHVRIKKNKVNGAFGEILLQITPRNGLGFGFEAAKFGVKTGLVTKSGSFFSVETLDGEVKTQGEAAFIAAMDKLSEAARTDLYDRLVKAAIEKRAAMLAADDDEDAPEAAEATDIAAEAADLSELLEAAGDEGAAA